MVLGSGIRDPGSGKNLFRIPDPGVKKAPDPDPQHWLRIHDILMWIRIRMRILLFSSQTFQMPTEN